MSKRKYFRAKEGTQTEAWIGNDIVVKGHPMMCTETEWYVQGIGGGTLVDPVELEEVTPPEGYEDAYTRAWSRK